MNLDGSEKPLEIHPGNPLPAWDVAPSDNPATIDGSPSEPTQPPPAPVGDRPFLSQRSCVTCRRRKVKCDKSVPCANCVRRGAACVFPPPGRARPRPRPRAVERMLQRSTGGRPVSDQTAAFVSKQHPTTSHSTEHLKHDETIRCKEQWIDRWWHLGERLPKRLYKFDKKPGNQPSDNEEEASCEYTLLLAKLSELVRAADECMSTDGDGEIAIDPDARNFDPAERFPQQFSISVNDHAFVLGGPSSDPNASSQKHPSPSQIPFYWQTFVENVDPLIKIFHIPTMNKWIRGIQGRIRSLDPAEEALMFALYFAAVGSMAPTEVQELLGQDKVTLITQYRHATEQALGRAEFMTSVDPTTLQAFVLFISCLRQYVQPRLTWTLTALAVRIAQGMGLQLSPDPQCSPYDLETRRRLWLCLWLLDLKTALDLGSDWLIVDDCTNLPLNINDSDIGPEGTEYLTSRTGMTDMAHVLVKYEIGLLMKRLLGRQSHKSHSLSQESMESMVATCKEQVEERYLRHCAEDDALQWLTAVNAKLAFATAPLLIYHSILSSDLRSNLSVSARNHLLDASIETIECLHVLETMSTPNRRGWLFGTYLHWHATALILEGLHLGSPGTDIARRAWNALELASGLWAASPGVRRAGGPWSALISLVEKAKQSRETNLDDAGSGIVSAANARPRRSVWLPHHVGTTSSIFSDVQGSINSMKHELHSAPDDFSETPNRDTGIVSTTDAMSFQATSIRPNWLMPGDNYSASEFTDNLPPSEGSFPANPGLPGVWPTENAPTEGLSWEASQALTETSADNTTEYWAVFNDLVQDLET
ncbi:fungal specific transcription factor domain-containing [Fusarium albosuccineum]|uniref:Fungal specific transcription factor domain-containing n=1 Tax=Fusarium albosuccineum TaxID=1237068 RepID=A0A8H4L2A0_9HYPO|nr:fungal specific transcription factor domain-containing [Fusarium albosuccineum]